jgi:hypothetical protein
MAGGSTIKIRRSAVAGRIPTTSDLALGELALNTYDGKIFLKRVQTVGQTTTEEIIALEKQLTAGTGVTIINGAITIGQNVSTAISPTFAGASFNGITTITQTALGKQDPLRVAGYVGSAGSVFTVGVSDTPSDGVTIKSLNSTLTSDAKLSFSGSQILLKTTNKQWSFSDNGNIQLPPGGDIVNSKNTSLLQFPSVKKITFDNPISTRDGSAPFTYATATDGSNNYITVNDSSIFTANSPIVFYGITSFGGLQHSLLFPPTIFFIKSIIDNKTITISDEYDGTIYPLSTDTGTMIISTIVGLAVTNVYSINGSNNQLTIDDTSIFSPGNTVTFYSSVLKDENMNIVYKRDYGNIIINGVYYVKEIIDGTTLTITNSPNGSTESDLTDYSYEINSPNENFIPMAMTLMTSSSYQIQRAPRLFTPFDSLETTGYDRRDATYGDMLWEDPTLFVLVDLGYGTPQKFSLSPP